MSEMQAHQDQPPPLSGHGDMGQDAGQNVPHGMGQSKSSRRRRRKRKGKGGDGVALAGSAQVGGDQGDFEASPAGSQAGDSAQHQPPARQQGQHANAGQQQNNGTGNGSGTKRWKKKFRDRDRQRPSDNPGNQASPASNGQNNGSHNNGGQNGGSRDRETHQFGNNGFKQRKGGGGKQQQRGPRSFVGPMDHSYRAVNGNFADAPPSTIEAHGNYGPRSNGRGGGGGYHSDSQPIDYSQGRAIPIPEDAQTKIFFFIDDLFFVAKIQETARKLGVKVEFVKNDKESLAKLTGVEEADRPALIVLDLNNANAKPMTLIPKLKAKFKKSTSLVGFLSHLQGDLKAKAVEAGCDSVMPRAAFSQNLPNLLRRYGIVEEEEANFNM
jgi:hypothetical protein